MNDAELDRAYTALCQAMGEAGEEKAPLFLAMMCLDLMKDRPCDEVLRLIERAKASLAGE